MAYRILAATHRMDVFLGASKSPKDSIGMCFKLLNKSIELDETYAEAYGALGFTLSMVGKHDKAVETAQKAVALDPNSANTYAMLGHTLRKAVLYRLQNSLLGKNWFVEHAAGPERTTVGHGSDVNLC